MINNFEKISSSIDSFKNLVIDIQKRLVSIPALGPENGGLGEYEKSVYVKELLEQLPFDEIKNVDAPDPRVPSGVRPNILAKRYGTNQDRTVWVLAHLDVVPPGDLELWESGAYNLRIDGDRLFARGVEDNHQGLVSALIALHALKAQNVKPHYNVGLAIVADEETGNKYGLDYVMKHHSHEFRKEDLILVPDAGDMEGRCIEVAEKSLLWVKFKISGKQCHASTPDLGNNAHKAGAFLITEMDRLYEMFDLIDDVFDPPTCTFEPTRKEENVPNINTIPGEDVVYYDCRILPQIPLDDVIEKMGNIVKDIEERFLVEIKVSFPQKEASAPPTSPESPVVNALSNAIRDVIGKEPQIIGIGGGTVAAIFRKAGYPAAVWGTIDDTAHQPNEYSLISNTLTDAKVMAHVFLNEKSGY
jgi:succinyl-diaminopimelate desuccinylase